MRTRSTNVHGGGEGDNNDKTIMTRDRKNQTRYVSRGKNEDAQHHKTKLGETKPLSLSLSLPLTGSD